MADLKKIRRKEIIVDLDRPRKLVYDLNAFAEMEDAYGSVDEAIVVMEKGSIKAVRFMLWAGLVSDDPTLTVQDVGALVGLADLGELAEHMNDAMSLDLPERVEESPNV